MQGRNIYPQDIENVVEACHPAIRAGCAAAFSVDINNQEQIVIVAEIERTYRKIDFFPVFTAIRQAVVGSENVIPYSIQLLAPAKALRTTSGKFSEEQPKPRMKQVN